MPTPYLLAVVVHVLAAIVWLGGMVFFALAAPVLRSLEDDALRARLFDALGRRFRAVGWICIALLVATGMMQLRLRGWWGAGFWSWATLTGTALGRGLLRKLAMVLLMVVIQAAHDFWLGPAAGRAPPGSAEALRLRRSAAWLARVNTVAGALLVWFAVGLIRGG